VARMGSTELPAQSLPFRIAIRLFRWFKLAACRIVLRTTIQPNHSSARPYAVVVSDVDSARSKTRKHPVNATQTVLSAETAGKTLAELPTDRPVVIYDGQCPLCLRSVAVLKRLDVFGRLAYHDARQPFAVPLTSPGTRSGQVTGADARGHAGNDTAALLRRFLRLPHLSLVLAGLLPILPLLYFAGAAWVGERIYAWIARNRFRLLPCRGKVCRLSPPHHGQA
jgi:predicted DCC family thiol-disulfide oxidoreductase YuxK